MLTICLCHGTEQKVNYTVQAPPVSMQWLFSAVRDYECTITWFGSGVDLPKEVSLRPDLAVAEATSSTIVLYIASLLHWWKPALGSLSKTYSKVKHSKVTTVL